MRHQVLNYKKIDQVMMINIFDTESDQVKVAQLSDELTDLCNEIVWDEEIRVVALTGAGEKSFSIGIDLIGAAPRIQSLAEPVWKLDQPVIAAINGDATGQGLELALACDIRVATEASHFGLPHIKKGLIPWDGGTQRLSRLVGSGKTLEMILTGEMIDAQEALRIGLVNKVVPREELMKAVTGLAQEMASKGPIALRYAKEAIHKGMDLTLEQGLRLEADLYLLLHTTKDRSEGIKAFREKKVPRFEGR
jgi:enoyl-CoA hydratase/carnithine racemase